MPLSQASCRAKQNRLKRSGDKTLVNGVLTYAKWTTAQLGRIQTFLAPEEWAKAGYMVEFSAEVLEAPWNLKDATPIVWVKNNWNGLVRKVDTDGTNNNIYSVVCIVMMSTENN